MLRKIRSFTGREGSAFTFISTYYRGGYDKMAQRPMTWEEKLRLVEEFHWMSDDAKRMLRVGLGLEESGDPNDYGLR